MEQILFWAMAGLAIAFAFGVVFSRNPIHSALSLIGLLFNTAGLYALLHGEFVAVIQVLVYTGAIMVLFVFVIMLLNLEPEKLLSANLRKVHIAAAIIMAITGARIAGLLLGLAEPEFFQVTEMSRTALEQFGSVDAAGRLLLTRYIVPFEAISVLFMAAIVGGVVIGKKRL